MRLTVYLAGQIHDDWRREVKEKAESKGLPVDFVGPMDNHERSDNIGEEILGEQPNAIYKDEVASRMNNLRTQVLLEKSDIVLAFFGEKYKQFNTAMDAATAISIGKPLILIRPENLHHPLKELSQRANVTVENIDQALQTIQYIFDTE
ncbi:YtoQ family protein [Texcoconibacillus texcoconensis]|uniref:YtoQ family protein n=1 Tax=Texcoconibacillus texcoconensis TaxID=1095777 RepID=A0A840QN39_9BACI|nr:YtoQ family protein [Texcoconibacillus texcoconensis]MBB5172789.1 YtoQ family protein [Texcoconibacillus texcoconensis]